MAYRVVYTKRATRDLSQLEMQIAQRIVDYIDKHVAPLTDPRSAGKALAGALGVFGRYRVGSCRIICDIQDEVMTV